MTLLSEHERRLAAVVVTDVVGYSRLMGYDEQGALAALKVLQREAIDPLIATHSGRLIKSMGDGLLLEFPSVQSAVRCSQEIQKAVEVSARDSDPNAAIRLRIGVHLGDVIVDGGDIFGDCVNIAARLQEVAKPGGIAISNHAFEHLDGRSGAQFLNLGRQSLKNIRNQIDVWLWAHDNHQTSGSEEAAKNISSERPAKPTIAVLPFRNLSGGSDHDGFADGLTEDLITAISYWRTFPVIARNSVFSFKDRSVKTSEIAKELGARYILEGSVRTASNRVRITASLLDTVQEHELWSERFDRVIDDIFVVQDEITSRVAALLGHQIEQAELARISAARNYDVTAWDLVIQGIPHFLAYNCPANAKARELFKRAIERSNDYDDAWAYLAWTHSHDLMLGCEIDRSQAAELGLEAGKRAVSLNENSALAHLALSSVYVWTGEARKGLTEAQRALDLNPNDVRAAFAVGNRLTLNGEFEKGIEIIEAAMVLNPRDPFRWHYFGYLSRAYLSSSRPDIATERAEVAVQLKPDQPETHFRLAMCHAHQGLLEDAQRELAKAEELEAGFVSRRKQWKPYPNEEHNIQILEPMRQAGLL
ncbi:MAG: hypothetical protein GKR97_00810 [Rhizobiaceae bacterium]|nr:hypothetical protein [Rhizobiaceae bacterium]